MRTAKDRTALALRQRSVWEAWDWGISLWRASLGASFLLLSLPALLLALALRLLLAGENPAWSWLAIWWLKPFLDRFFLQVLSRRFVSPGLPLGQALRAAGQRPFAGLIHDLSWRRFDPMRSTRMPLFVLEGARGKKARERWKSMERQQGWSGAALTLLCLCIEVFLLLGAAAFVAQLVMMGGTAQALWEALGGPKAVEPALYAGFCLGIALMEPLYVAMGFAQYLNRRVGTEGWDLARSFKEFADSRASPKGAPGGASPLLLLLCLGLAVHPALGAQEVPRESLDRILESREFGWEEEGWGVRFRDWGEAPEVPENAWAFMDGSRELLGAILRFGLLAILALGLSVLLVFLFARLKGARSLNPRSPYRKKERPPGPLRAAELLDRAQASIAAGRRREAWAYCARGILDAYASRAELRFPPDATEGECLRIAAGGGEGYEGLKKHIGAWIRLAYAGRAPAEGAFEEALAWGKALLVPPEASS